MIYINVSNTFIFNLKTGIQRVVRNISLNLYRHGGFKLIYNHKGIFYELNEEQLFIFSEANKVNLSDFKSNRQVDFQPNDSFFEIDARWSDRTSSIRTYEQLKSLNVKIISLCHDIIPAQFPEYCQINSAIRWHENFSASLIYTDYWITTTHAVRSDLLALAEQYAVKRPIVEVLPLGADFKEAIDDTTYNEEAYTLNHLGKFVLFVGTVEPRKNVSLLLESFEQWLEKIPDLNLVIVGKVGWNSSDLISRIKNHPLFNKKLFMLNNANDVSLQALYRLCFCTINLSLQEGFGLPIVESLYYGAISVTSPIEVFKEVSQSKNYPIDQMDADSVVRALDELSDPERYRVEKEKISYFSALSWHSAANGYLKYFLELEDRSSMMLLPTQAVYISNNIEKCFISAQSACEHMKFIDHIIVACPNDMQESFRNTLKTLPIKVSILDELALLNNSILPQDHAKRNSLLRQKLYASEIIAENFIAFDDDYVVIEDIDVSFYLNNGVHTGYFHCDSKDIWFGDYSNPTSYDRCCWKTRLFLKSSGYDTKLYNSHMPQIFNKKLVEIAYSYCLNMGLDEWSSYFNIAKFLAPNNFRDAYYCAAGWPQNPEDWLPPLPIEKANFLNYYPQDIKKNESYRDYSVRWIKNLNHYFSSGLANILLEPPMVIIAENGLDANVIELSWPKEAKLKIWLEKKSVQNVAFIQWKFGDHNIHFPYTQCPPYIYVSKSILEKESLRGHAMDICIHLLDKDLKKLSELIISVNITSADNQHSSD